MKTTIVQEGAAYLGATFEDHGLVVSVKVAGSHRVLIEGPAAGQFVILSAAMARGLATYLSAVAREAEGRR